MKQRYEHKGEIHQNTNAAWGSKICDKSLFDTHDDT